MPFGTVIVPENGVLFRLWAPMAKNVDLCLMPDEAAISTVRMTKDAEGWFVVHDRTAKAGDRYQFRIDNSILVPDPVSRFQAHDVHGPSIVCDPDEFHWHDQSWTGRPWPETIIYELHVGTFSPQGTFKGVSEKLDYLVELGVTAIELMPLAHFPGNCNWGYDGDPALCPVQLLRQPGRPEKSDSGGSRQRVDGFS